LCIHFQNVNTKVSFVIDDTGTTIFDPINKQIDLSMNTTPMETCYDIKINNYQLKNDYQMGRIRIKGQTTDGYKFESTKSFSLKKQNSITFIETDKPVYKPSDKLRIRILSLDYKLTPLLNSRFDEIFVVDSSETRVNQWNNLEAPNGLIQLDMDLSEEPNLGTWKIVIPNSRDTVIAQFEVKKYVLPKFDITINHNPTILLNQKKFNLKLCSQFSFNLSLVFFVINFVI
jgi:uncharacterized protein YfaS (alpha-2-macroglobulin family)